ncbi:uncharacterized protein LOC129297044 [Prosopis cineraria]|uniref:uncharacterized protein LOC129297044 n=1 Tax=Prosopis cineraria TaxID=364024 RepID=UPI00240FAF02|nr:uncharacterized protein LOC129297044 [Prosopis cineraria]
MGALKSSGPNGLNVLFFQNQWPTVASLHQAEIVMQTIKCFYYSSGLKVNSDKTRVFYSHNVNHNRSREINSILGFMQTANLGKYLRVPLLHSRVKNDIFEEVVDKVKRSLSSWKVNSLSSAGGATLLSSVTSAIPSHIMQYSSLPINTCEHLDQCNRSFHWGSDGN